MQNILIVDRVEGGFAICEDERRKTHTIQLSGLPGGLREGDCLRESGSGYIIDREETQRRREQNKALFEKLLKKRMGDV